MMTLMDNQRRKAVKQSFAVRRVPLEAVQSISARPATPRAGDVVLARVMEVGRLPRIELPTGRKAALYPGDEILVAYGNRYAADAYEAELPSNLGVCELAAAGGLAARIVSTNVKFASEERPPTRLKPLGLCLNSEGRVINVADYALHSGGDSANKPPVIAVFGASMNAGKTTTVAGIVRGLASSHYRVGVAKVTGTCSGGDLWKVLDAGAMRAIDFTDAGLATTYKAPLEEVITASEKLIQTLQGSGCDVIVLEIADGIHQQETAALLRNPDFTDCIDHWVYASDSASGVMLGVEAAAAHDLELVGISGAVTASPLAMREAAALTDVALLPLPELESGEMPGAWLKQAQAQDMPHLIAV